MKRVWILAIGIATLVAGVYTLSAQQVGWPPPPGTQAFLCVYNASPPSLSTGVAAFVQCDSSGNVRTTGGGGGGGDATAANQTLQITQETLTNMTLGTTASAAATVGSTGDVSAKLRLMTTQLDNINTNIQGSIPAGTNTIGTVGQLPYPVGATPYTGTATGTTGATTATLAASGGAATTYICGFSIRANATAAATGNATVTGVITATLNFTQWTAPNASGLGVTEMIFAPCIPASANNVAIAVVSAAPGTGGVVSVTAWGYKL